jgi:hypothetical protein
MNAPVATPPWLQRQLDTLVQERSHAVLLFGSGGIGQYELALDLARAWLCESPQQRDRIGRACGTCGSCHAIEVRTHADLLVLMPETVQMELGWPLSEKAQSDIDEKRRKASREIRVDAMRDAVEFAQRTSGRGQSKIVLVYPAEKMNAVAANALLKTLEEPPGSVRFILATEAAHELLPTIRSRCLAHALHLPRSAGGAAMDDPVRGARGGRNGTAGGLWGTSGPRGAVVAGRAVRQVLGQPFRGACSRGGPRYSTDFRPGKWSSRCKSFVTTSWFSRRGAHRAFFGPKTCRVSRLRFMSGP